MMADTYERRRERAASLISAAGLDAAAFVPGPNFLYLTGLNFHLMERPTILFVTKNADVAAIMPQLEQLKWSTAMSGAPTFYWQDSDGFDHAFAAAAKAFGEPFALGVEGGRMRVFEYDALLRHFPEGSVADSEKAMAHLRVAKDSSEVACLEMAIGISELALAETLDEVRPGVTEKHLQNFIRTRMLHHGADGFSFSPIVLSGAKAADPHGISDGTGIKAGDCLLLDFGAQVEGYNADITRTFFVSHASDEHAAIYEAVRSANQVGRDVCGPSMTAHSLDTAVTDVLLASPYAYMVVHKTGHGLGLDVHEAPQVMIGNHVGLVPGAVVTIEPGLYRPGQVGVRIEDDVLVEETGRRSLTNFDRELKVLA